MNIGKLLLKLGRLAYVNNDYVMETLYEFRDICKWNSV